MCVNVCVTLYVYNVRVCIHVFLNKACLSSEEVVVERREEKGDAGERWFLNLKKTAKVWSLQGLVVRERICCG